MDVDNAEMAGVRQGSGEKPPRLALPAARGQHAGTEFADLVMHGEVDERGELPGVLADAEGEIAVQRDAGDIAGDGMIGQGAGEAPVTVVRRQCQQVLENGRPVTPGEPVDGRVATAELLEARVRALRGEAA